ncbi:MAG TPA: cupin domain-containing protein [Terriglobales bacterium]|nr:cupin domain-containing protein [Terriglobales bacterium]
MSVGRGTFVRRLGGVLIVVAVAVSRAHPQTPAPHKDRGHVSLVTPLPPLDGQHLKATLVEVNYGPGEASPPHSHPCAVVGYVVEGAMRMRVEGQPVKVYSAGDSFYEAPNGVHAVSANASETKPAKFVAYFVCDREQPLSVDVPSTTPKGK